MRWRRKGIWEHLLELLIDELDYEWLMLDASHCSSFSWIVLDHRGRVVQNASNNFWYLVCLYIGRNKLCKDCSNQHIYYHNTDYRHFMLCLIAFIGHLICLFLVLQMLAPSLFLEWMSLDLLQPKNLLLLDIEYRITS